MCKCRGSLIQHPPPVVVEVEVDGMASVVVVVLTIVYMSWIFENSRPYYRVLTFLLFVEAAWLLQNLDNHIELGIYLQHGRDLESPSFLSEGDQSQGL